MSREKQSHSDLNNRIFRKGTARRRLSQLMVLVLFFSMFQGTIPTGIIANAGEESQLTIATPSDARVKWTQKAAEDVQVSVISDMTTYSAGDQASVTVYVKNNTDKTISEGKLTYKASGIEKDSAYFDPMTVQIQEDEAALTATASDATESDAMLILDGDEEVFGEEPTELRNLVLYPGQTYIAQFYFTIDSEINKIKDQKISFKFSGKEDKKSFTSKYVQSSEEFRYVVGGLNLDPFTVSDDEKVLTNEDQEMTLSFSLGEIQDIIEEAEDGSATPSNADFVAWEVDKATSSNASADSKLIRNLSCNLETYGLKLKGFKVEGFDETQSTDQTMVTVRFRVAADTAPGTYFGKATTSYKIKSKKFNATQGFKIVVAGEGNIELTGKIGDSEILVTGPAESFPEADDYAIQVSEVSDEQQQKVDEVLQKKTEEENVEVTKYRALDIKLFADGVETEPTGDLQVSFKNVKLEAKDEQQNVVLEDAAEAISTMSLEESPEITEQTAAETTAATENIKVLHLDEEAMEVNEMESSVENNGDVVMTTDHFSVYIMVQIADLNGTSELTIQHYAYVDVLGAVDGDAPDTNLKDDTNLIRHTVYSQIYTTDVETVNNMTPNLLIEKLSKVSNSGENYTSNYRVDAVWQWVGAGEPEGEPKQQEENWKRVWTYDVSKPLADQETVNCIIKKDTILRIEYKSNEARYPEIGSAIFYDYDLQVHKDASGNQVPGINDNSNFADETSPRIGVGSYPGKYNSLSDEEKALFENDYNRWSKNGNVAAVPGIVEKLDVSGNPVYKSELIDANLFNEIPVSGKTIYNDYSLQFQQTGDTYTLSRVKKGDKIVSKDLETLAPAKRSDSPIFVNGFWPLDSVAGGNHDSTIAGCYDKNVISGSHNCYFGMRYTFKFKLNDYVGPLNYYFRGDDDFWFFIDGKLAVDLGGIHDPQGSMVDLYDYIEKDETDKEHEITILYAERGGYASTCYMEFTIPNVFDTPPVPTTDQATLTIEKKWKDSENNALKVTTPVNVKLQYRYIGETDWKDFSAQGYELNATNDFRKEDIIVIGGYKSEDDNQYTPKAEYRVREVSVNGYTTTYESGEYTDGMVAYDTLKNTYSITITNTKLPGAKLRVKKVVDYSPNTEASKDDTEFIIDIKEVETGTFKSSAVLENDEESGYVYLDFVSLTQERKIQIDEILPMEYSFVEYVVYNRRKDLEYVGTYKLLNSDTIRVKSGDDILVEVRNKFTHKPYFHHDDSVNNFFESGK